MNTMCVDENSTPGSKIVNKKTSTKLSEKKVSEKDRKLCILDFNTMEEPRQSLTSCSDNDSCKEEVESELSGISLEGASSKRIDGIYVDNNAHNSSVSSNAFEESHIQSLEDIAEEARLKLEKCLEDNKELHQIKDELDDEYNCLKRENISLKHLVKDSQDLLDMVRESVGDDITN